MLSYKFPLTAGNVTRFFIIFILLLLLASGLIIRSAVNNWLADKRYAMVDIAHTMQQRIDAWRFATWQIYENLSASAAGTPPVNLQETRLRPDVYYLEKSRRKTEALIFGSHDSSTLDMTLRMSTYLDTLWGAENSTWSMYFLNGQDNSLILISTLPLKDMTTLYKENAISAMVDARRVEMLQQANALDERESFSPLRRFSWQNDHYFTVRTTFNQPGHLATVVAFDLPVDDLIPVNMPLENFQLKLETTDKDEASAGTVQNTRVIFSYPDVDITASLGSTPLKLIYRVPMIVLATDILRNLLWPLLANGIMLLLSLSGLLMLRQQALRPSENQSAELDSLRVLSEEIVGSLPVGLLVYDFANNRTIISNKIAEHLLPHLNLQKIVNMSDQHQGMLQATINNEVYEIRHSRSILSSHTQIFMMRDQDRELLVNKKLQKAQQVLDKNHQTRQQLLQNLGQALNRPLARLTLQLQAIHHTQPAEQVDDAQETLQSLSRLVDDIVLLNRLETHEWTPDTGSFVLQKLLDDLVVEALPLLRRKGLSLIVSNQLSVDERRFGDSRAVYKILSTLLHYAITNTTWGRISIDVQQSADRPERIMVEIVDTGAGLSIDEQGNSDFPFLGETTQDRFGQASGLAFFLCRQLCKHLGGRIDIVARADIGTRYSIYLHAPQEQQTTQEEEKLLDGLTVLIDITVNDVRKIVMHQLACWGADCITTDERFTGQDHDVLITDDPARLAPWTLLLTGDEPGFRALSENQFSVNFNISSAMQDALLQLIERRLSQDEVDNDKSDEQSTVQLFAPGYFQLFVDTVPEDVKRLYNEAADRDFNSLAQTAHRLKGVFAMLNLTPGKQLCETLEMHIKACNDLNIKNTTSQIDDYVNTLLKQGNQ